MYSCAKILFTFLQRFISCFAIICGSFEPRSKPILGPICSRAWTRMQRGAGAMCLYFLAHMNMDGKRMEHGSEKENSTDGTWKCKRNTDGTRTCNKHVYFLMMIRSIPLTVVFFCIGPMSPFSSIIDGNDLLKSSSRNDFCTC